MASVRVPAAAGKIRLGRTAAAASSASARGSAACSPGPRPPASIPALARLLAAAPLARGPAGAPRLNRAVASRAAPGDARTALKEWFHENGGEMEHKVELTTDGYGGVGILAAADISDSEVILQLPPELAFAEATPGSFPTSDTMEKVAALIPEENFWGLRLAARLLLEAKENQAGKSTWGPYFDQLPKMVPGMPIFFPPDMLQELQYPPVVLEAQQRVGALFKLCSDGGPMEGLATVEEMAWAFSLVSSRAVRVEGADKPGALLPICDFANHDFDHNARLQKSSMANEYQLLATRGINTGEPIHINYGPLSNDGLLQDYGFIVPGNAFDRVQLRFGSELIAAAVGVAADAEGAIAAGRSSLPAHVLESPEEAVAARKPMLDQLTYVMGVTGSQAAQIGGPQLVNEPLWLAAQMVCATSDDEAKQVLQEFVMAATQMEQAKGSAPIVGIDLVSEGMRAGVVQLLQGVCEVALYSFPSSLEDDIVELNGLPPKEAGEPEGLEMIRIALEFRAGRKRSVRAVQEQLAAAI